MIKACIALTASFLSCSFISLAHATDRGDSRSHLVAQAPATQKPGSAPAGEPPVAREFEPPPVPEFMLRKPAQPLTPEEMRRQADEAAERARRARAAANPSSTAAEPAPAAPGYR